MRTSFKTITAAAVLGFATVGQAFAATELVNNGSFEAQVVADDDALSITPSGWAVTGGSRLINPLAGSTQPAPPVIDGDNYLRLMESSSLSQSLSSTANQQYTLSFNYSLKTNHAAQVSVNGQTFSLDANKSSFSYTFSAAAASTQLSFSTLTGRLQLDGVSVTAVPEPAAAAMLLAGLGLLAARRRQRGQAQA
ncbi:MAG: hypothetical protein C4K60_12470 [Ideonella sp. MAG2]|nr:MAG: hypothetical protein C4K60_12470 [Ideonella sp. MAG2]